LEVRFREHLPELEGQQKKNQAQFQASRQEVLESVSSQLKSLKQNQEQLAKARRVYEQRAKEAETVMQEYCKQTEEAVVFYNLTL